MTKPPAGLGVDLPPTVKHEDDSLGGVLVTKPDSRCLTRFKKQPEV